MTAAAWFLVSAAYCQDKKAGSPPKKEMPKAEELSINTQDGLQLALTYYPGANGKQTIPIVLLHGWRESRNDYKDFAPLLQRLGYAVIVPDLRGHGDSTRFKGAGRDIPINADKMSTQQQLPLMVTEDMMAVKAFLWERNNAGEFNIDKLCIVGTEMGASVAINFAATDAAQQEQNNVFGFDREYKLGRFVKVLVLISPERAFRGIPILPSLKNPVVQRDIAVMILVGKQNSKAMDEAKQIYGLFKKHHHDPGGEDNDNADKRTLVFLGADTKLQGTKLVDAKLKVPITLYTGSQSQKTLDAKDTVPSQIAAFLDSRLVKSEESRGWKWLERKQPHQ